LSFKQNQIKYVKLQPIRAQRVSASTLSFNRVHLLPAALKLLSYEQRFDYVLQPPIIMVTVSVRTYCIPISQTSSERALNKVSRRERERWISVFMSYSLRRKKIF